MNTLEAAIGSGSQVNNPAVAEVIAATLSAIVGKPPEDEDATPSTIGIQLTQQATEASEALVNSILEMNVPDPSLLIPTYKHLMEALGTVMEVGALIMLLDFQPVIKL